MSLAEVAFVEFKTCTKCKKEYPITSYWKQTKASDGLNTWCKFCVSTGMRIHARKRKREAIQQLGGKCTKCHGVFHQAAYDFHHLDTTQKETGIARLLQSYSVDHPKVQQELDKCILLCSNCHRVLHSFTEDINE